MVLAATDVAARGLDVSDIDIVIQGSYQKGNIDSILHRLGRTGRAGKKGLNILIGMASDIQFFKKMESSLKIDFNIKTSASSTVQEPVADIPRLLAT